MKRRSWNLFFIPMIFCAGFVLSGFIATDARADGIMVKKECFGDPHKPYRLTQHQKILSPAEQSAFRIDANHSRSWKEFTDQWTCTSMDCLRTECTAEACLRIELEPDCMFPTYMVSVLAQGGRFFDHCIVNVRVDDADFVWDGALQVRATNVQPDFFENPSEENTWGVRLSIKEASSKVKEGQGNEARKAMSKAACSKLMEGLEQTKDTSLFIEHKNSHGYWEQWSLAYGKGEPQGPTCNVWIPKGEGSIYMLPLTGSEYGYGSLGLLNEGVGYSGPYYNSRCKRGMEPKNQYRFDERNRIVFLPPSYIVPGFSASQQVPFEKRWKKWRVDNVASSLANVDYGQFRWKGPWDASFRAYMALVDDVLEIEVDVIDDVFRPIEASMNLQDPDIKPYSYDHVEILLGQGKKKSDSFLTQTPKIYRGTIQLGILFLDQGKAMVEQWVDSEGSEKRTVLHVNSCVWAMRDRKAYDGNRFWFYDPMLEDDRSMKIPTKIITLRCSIPLKGLGTSVKTIPVTIRYSDSDSPEIQKTILSTEYMGSSADYPPPCAPNICFQESS